MCIISFKERVKNIAILNAKIYEKVYIEYEYLVCSEAFGSGYHVIKCDKGNYLHLIGIHTDLSAEDFFNKCVTGKLLEIDFDFQKPGKPETSVKGSVREKIAVLPVMMTLFKQKLTAQDNFKKNKVECAFATTDNVCTLGFARSGRPKSLLKGNKLEKSDSQNVDLIFRKKRHSGELYGELVFGDKQDIKKYKEQITDLIDPKFFK